MKKRKPASASARQKISRALKGRKRKGTGSLVRNNNPTVSGTLAGAAQGLVGGAALGYGGYKLLHRSKKTKGSKGVPIYQELPKELTPVGYQPPDPSEKKAKKGVRNFFKRKK